MTSSRKTKAALQAAPDLHAQLGLRPGQSIELLKELHILTRDGRLNQDSRRKLKQVNHLLQFIEKVRQELPPREGGLLLADHGAGKSYLGFMLYDLWCTRYEPGRELGHLYGIETRADLVERSRELAARLGFERMSFINTSAAESAASAALPDVFDVVTALHACDTATDDAIAFALRKQARAIVLAPCCQAEVAARLRMNKALQLARTPLAELWRHPLHTREMGSQLTNVLRCLYLESQGYAVTVTELVGWEHSMKNELIIADVDGPQKAQRRRAPASAAGAVWPGGFAGRALSRLAGLRTCSKSARGCKKRGLGRSAALQILAGPQGPSAACALQLIPIRTFAPHGQALNRFWEPIQRGRRAGVTLQKKKRIQRH